MVIAVEIDNIIRDNNTQALKYFLKDYNPMFDDENVDLNCTNLLEELPFATKEGRKYFKELDYPYELFGCARTMTKHIHVELSDWLDEHEDIEIIYFSMNNADLVIQSTYFFLSKGSRVKRVMFPKNPKDIWKYCDVTITINKDVVNNKPNDKRVIVIAKSDNEDLQNKADAVYNSFSDFLSDKSFDIKLLTKNKKNNNFLKKIKLPWMNRK